MELGFLAMEFQMTRLAEPSNNKGFGVIVMMAVDFPGEFFFSTRFTGVRF